ncbi:MAG TPA: NADH:flavin oxidoreductase, partial [Chloroflexota bacterium]
LLPRTIVESIEPGGVVRVRCDGRGETLGPFDTIVLAAGYRPRNELYHQLRGQVAEVYLVGDALQPRSAVEAVLEAARTALAI